MGRLLGLGPCGELLIYAMAGRDSLSSLRHGTREAKDVQGLEPLSDHCHLLAIAARNLSRPQRHPLLCPCLCKRSRPGGVYTYLHVYCADTFLRHSYHTVE